jgi:hypothetical protein
MDFIVYKVVYTTKWLMPPNKVIAVVYFLSQMDPDPDSLLTFVFASVNINASYIEALLHQKLIRCKIYF